MIKKRKMWSVIGIMAVFLLSALPIDTKGMEEDPVWEITWRGQGNTPFFQSSVMMEIDLKGENTKEDVEIFINKQKWEGDWDYDKNVKIMFTQEGAYEIHLVHKNGYEETKNIIVELNNPTAAKIDAGSYHAGTWTNKDITLKAYGASTRSKVSYYEYKIGNAKWQIMKDHHLKINENFDDIILIRAVSKAGRQGEITKIWCRLWKNSPKLPRLNCDQKSKARWYHEMPQFSFDMPLMEGPFVHTYAKVINLRTKQGQTVIDEKLHIKEDGIYQLKVWTKDEAGNKSQNSIYEIYFVDTKKPEIFVQYEEGKNAAGILKYQKAKIKISDENLNKRSVKIKTSAKQTKGWKQEGAYYETEVIFDRDGEQNLVIQAQDMSGNEAIREEKPFKIDTRKPKINVLGIRNGKSYNKAVKMNIKISDENLDHEKTKIYLNGKIWAGTVIQKDGYYTLDVETQDLAGNKKSLQKKFTVNKKGIDINFLQENVKGKYISVEKFKPGFRIKSLEPVQIMQFLVNGEKVRYEWHNDKVYTKDPIADNGKCTISLRAKDANGALGSSENITFFYDTIKPVIKIKGLNKNNESVYGNVVKISLENKKDYWNDVKLDGKTINCSKNIICFEKLNPGQHRLSLKAQDQAGNKVKKEVKIVVTKILPEPIKKIIKKEETKAKKIRKNKKKKKSYEKMIFISAGITVIVFLYIKCQNYRKHQHS